MTENSPKTPPAETTEAPADEATPEQRPNREARYRVERNEARTERDALTERIGQLQRAEVERLASSSLAQPSDIFKLSGSELEAYLSEDGSVDAELVAESVALVLSERPGLRKQTGAHDPSQALGGKAPVKREPSWAALLG